MAIDITNSAEYTEIIRKINLWYGNDAQKLIDIANTWELTPEQLTTDWLSGSGYEPWYTSSGAVGGYNATGTSAINYATAAQESINSNAGSVTQVALKTPVEQTINQSGKVVTSNGLTSVATGLKSGLTFVSTEVLPAVSAAGLGIALGKTIDSALYNANPNFWDNIGMSSLNPETWNDITRDYPDGVLKKAFNTVFGLNPNTGETQMFLDQQAAAYLAMYMNQNGFFATGGFTPEPTPTIGQDVTIPYTANAASLSTIERYQSLITGFQSRGWPISGAIVQTGFIVRIYPSPTYTSQTGRVTDVSTYPSTGNEVWKIANSVSVSGTYYEMTNTGQFNTGTSSSNITGVISYHNASEYQSASAAIVGIVQLGTATPAMDGVTDQTGATLPDFSNCQTPEDYLHALQNQYPDMFNNAVTQTVVEPDGTPKTTTYIPVGTPSKNNNGNKTQPVTNTDNSGNKQSNTNSNPNSLDLTGLENLIKTLTDTISQTGTPTNPTNPDPTGTGNTPPVVAPTGQATALFAVYNPSQAQLNSFGGWLWSSNFIDQVLKLFNNPMQAIIGLHKIFVSPSISGSGNIKVGYLDSGVSSNIVGAQYTTINCGSVKVSEQFGNVFDYTDTQIRLYLPFIGIVDLDVADVMRGTVSVVYHVDVISGACLAEVKITRDGSGGTLYQYAGDAAVRYPISSGSYMGVVSGVLSAVGGIASAVMTGGATLPIAAGAVAGGLSGAHTQIQHSGNFAGNAGAMGAKKPYIIIERPQTAVAEDYKKYVGNGANVIKNVSEMNGYFRMSDVKLTSVSGASESELNEIKTALESGVIK